MFFVQNFNHFSIKARAESSSELSQKSSSNVSSENDRKSITVSLSAEGGKLSVSSKTVFCGSTYGTLPTPTLEGYTFDGWYTEKKGGTFINEESKVAESNDHILYAHWHPVVCTINFNGNGGSLSGNDSMKVVYGQKYGELPIPTLTDYSFGGWYTLPVGGEIVTEKTVVNITSSITLYAHWLGASPVITFNANGGTVSGDPKKVNYGENYGELPIPVREGYTFKGWYLSIEGATEITKNTSVNCMKDHTLYAQWTKNGYKVNLDANGGYVSSSSQSILYGGIYGTLPTPTYSGHTFLGWYTSKDGETAPVLSGSLCNTAANHTLYAHWAPNHYTVRLLGNGASVPYSNIKVTYDENYNDLPTLKMEHYTFEGWYTMPSSGTKITVTDKVNIISDITLYAHWVGNTYTVRLDPNGGSVYTTEVKVRYGSAYNNILPTPNRIGYIFDGWFTSKSGGEKVTSNNTIRLTDDQTLYARWTAKQPTINLYCNDGSMIINGEKVTSYQMECTYDQTYGTLPTPTREGYTFDGWYTSSYSGDLVTASTLVNVSESFAIYAHWIGNTYEVSYNANGGEVSNRTQNVIFGQNYGTMPIPQKANCTFDGWYTKVTGGEQISSGSRVNFFNKQTLYAHWKGVSSTVTYDANGGYTSTTAKLVSYGEPYGTLPLPVKNGYTFLGWFTAAIGGTSITKDDVVNITEAQTLYAHWQSKESIITFDANGGADTAARKAVTYGDPYGALPTPTRKGYTFGGWFTSRNGSSQIFENDIVTLVNDFTLYAKWIGNTCVVSFNAKGGTTTTTSKEVTYGSSYGSLPYPSRENYTFIGWYTEKSGGINIVSNSTVEIAKSHTLYAHWQQEVYTVTFSANGGNVSPGSTTVTIGDTYSTLPIPTKEGYSFDGWHTSTNTSAEEIYYTTEAITLYAHWAPNNYKVILDGNAENVSALSTIVTYGENYGTLPTPTRKNHTFVGWYTAKSGGTLITASSKVYTADVHTLYARWTGIQSVVDYDSNGGNVITEKKTVACGSTYGSLPTPVRAGYSFDGWFTKASGGDFVNYDSIVERDANHTLYAHWSIKTLTIVFSANGGRVLENGIKVSSLNVIRPQGKPYGELPPATREGYIFEGWYTSTSGGEKISKDTTVKIDSSITAIILYARWTSICNTVHFDPNGGSVPQDSIKVNFDGTYGAMPVPSMEGHNFIGWYTKEIGGTKVDSTTKVTILNKQTLYAHWEICTYQVTYDFNGGFITVEYNKKTYTSTSTTRWVAYNGTYGSLDETLPNPAKAGYDFDGFYTMKEGGELVTLSSDFVLHSNQTLYAHWIARDIPVLFCEKGGNPLSSQREVTFGKPYGKLPIPTRKYYTFNGWLTPSGKITEDTIVAMDYLINIDAQWIPETYTVKLNANGGSVKEQSITVNFEKTYGTLPTPTRKNHIFTGWYDSPSGGTQISSDSVVNITSDTAIYAHWMQETYGLSFNAYGGNVSTTSKTVFYGQTYGTLPVPTNYGYTFDGWYTDKTGGALVSATDTVTISNSILLYARWKAKTPTILFYANGGNLKNASKTVVYGGTCGEMPTPTLAHYTFGGWRTALNGSYQIKEATRVDNENTLILYAYWTPDTYTITFNQCDGKAPSQQRIVSYEKAYGSLSNLTRPGYKFLGWYTAETGGILITADTLVTTTSDHTLYAHWKGEDCTVNLNANGGSVSVSKVTVSYNEAYGELPVPTRKGYHFDGWFTKLKDGTLISATDKVTTRGSITLYAYWSVKKPTVTFDANGGEVDTKTITVTYGSSYGKLPVPTMEYCTFAGWYTSEGKQLITLDSIVSDDNDHTLYAYWTEKELTESEMWERYLKKAIIPQLIMNGQDIKSIDEISMKDDYDNDGLSLEQEYEYDTNPFSNDSDEDGLADNDEISVYKTDPLNTDTDQDDMSDGTEVNSGLNPLSDDTDGDGTIDSKETITQPVNIEKLDPIDINKTLVKPSVEITGQGDYNQKMYAVPVTEGDMFKDMDFIVGNAFEFVHDDDMEFESSTLTFKICDSVLENTPIEDLAVAYYNEDDNILELLDTPIDNVEGRVVSSIAATGSAISTANVSGSAITVAATGNAISAVVDHYSTYMVVNKNRYYKKSCENNEGASTIGYLIRLSDGNFVTLNANPSLGDDTVDTDKDGLPDLYELKYSYKVKIYDNILKQYNSITTWSFYSNPTKADTDGDGISDKDDWRPSRFDTVVKKSTDSVIEFNTGRTWHNITCTSYDYMDNMMQFVDNHVDNPIPLKELNIIADNDTLNCKQKFNIDELAVIGLVNNEGSKLYMTLKSKYIREKVFSKLSNRRSDDYRHKGLGRSWKNWNKVPKGTKGGFFKGTVLSEADINFSIKVFTICDVYTVLDSLAKAGALVIAVIVIVDATPVVLANVQGIVYYCKLFGIVEGLKMYQYLGIENLPNGIITWLQMDMEDGDSSWNDLASSVLTRHSVEDKLSRYLLNIDHPIGGSKAKWFKEALGFTQENMIDLAKQIVFDPKKAIQTGVTEYGTKFNSIISITGANGKVIDVTFAWIKNAEDGMIRLVTAIPTNK